MSEWHRIDDPEHPAPKGRDAETVNDPNWVKPPLILLLFKNGEQSVGCWDFYFAPGGDGHQGVDAWVEPISGELLVMHYDPPTHWQPLPEPPRP